MILALKLKTSQKRLRFINVITHPVFNSLLRNIVVHEVWGLLYFLHCPKSNNGSTCSRSSLGYSSPTKVWCLFEMIFVCSTIVTDSAELMLCPYWARKYCPYSFVTDMQPTSTTLSTSPTGHGRIIHTPLLPTFILLQRSAHRLRGILSLINKRISTLETYNQLTNFYPLLGGKGGNGGQSKNSPDLRPRDQTRYATFQTWKFSLFSY